MKPVGKRGGARRPIRRRKITPINYYKDNKNGIFPKRLGSYRFLISTDFTPDDICALSMFLAWVRTNQNFFEARTNFPIYGFITERPDEATGYLQNFASELQWDTEDHHLYSGYQSTLRRIWSAPDQNEICQVKPQNLLILHLKPCSMNIFDDCVNIVCGSTEFNGLTINCNISGVLTPGINGALFKEIEFYDLLHERMISVADDDYQKNIQELGYDLGDDYDCFLEWKKETNDITNRVEMYLKYDGQILEYKSQLAIIAMLIGSTAIENSPFILERSGNKYSLALKEGKTGKKFIADMLFAAIK